MSITHTIIRGVQQGGESIVKTLDISAGAENNIDEPIPIGASSLPVAFAFVKAKLQSIVIVTDQDIELFTNAVDTDHQVETAVIVGTITMEGNATVVVTAAGMANSPKTLSVAVALDDTADLVAGKIRAALAADEDVAGFFTVGGSTINVALTARLAAANDVTMNIAYTNGTCTGLTPDATSNDTLAGVAPSYQERIALTANEPVMWTVSDAPFIPNLFIGNVTGLYVTNGSGVATILQIRSLVDPT